MAGNVAGRVIEEYFPKSVFSRRFASLSEAEQGVRSASERLSAVIGGMSPEDLLRPAAPGKWSPGEVADHLVLANGLLANCIGASAGPSKPPYGMARGRVSAGGKAISAPEGEPRQGRSRSELIADIRRTADTLLASIKVAGEIGTANDRTAR